MTHNTTTLKHLENALLRDWPESVDQFTRSDELVSVVIPPYERRPITLHPPHARVTRPKRCNALCAHVIAARCGCAK